MDQRVGNSSGIYCSFSKCESCSTVRRVAANISSLLSSSNEMISSKYFNPSFWYLSIISDDSLLWPQRVPTYASDESAIASEV